MNIPVLTGGNELCTSPSPPSPFCLFVCLCLVACGILVPRSGIEPMTLALEVWSLNHWIARDVPLLCLYSNFTTSWNKDASNPHFTEKRCEAMKVWIIRPQSHSQAWSRNGIGTWALSPPEPTEFPPCDVIFPLCC